MFQLLSFDCMLIRRHTGRCRVLQRYYYHHSFIQINNNRCVWADFSFSFDEPLHLHSQRVHLWHAAKYCLCPSMTEGGDGGSWEEPSSSGPSEKTEVDADAVCNMPSCHRTPLNLPRWGLLSPLPSPQLLVLRKASSPSCDGDSDPARCSPQLWMPPKRRRDNYRTDWFSLLTPKWRRLCYLFFFFF